MNDKFIASQGVTATLISADPACCEAWKGCSAGIGDQLSASHHTASAQTNVRTR